MAPRPSGQTSILGGVFFVSKCLLGIEAQRKLKTFTIDQFRYIKIQPGAIIGDGDRKSWDPRAPMIWDNFSIFRTNCAILTSNIRADPRTCRELSRGCCHVA